MFLPLNIKTDLYGLPPYQRDEIVKEMCFKLTCWHWALTGLSSPAFCTDTRKLVYLIHTSPSIQAWRRHALIEV